MRVPIAWKPDTNGPVELALIYILPEEVIWPIIQDINNLDAELASSKTCFPTNNGMSVLLKQAQVTQRPSISGIYDWGFKHGLNGTIPDRKYPFTLSQFKDTEGLRRLINDHLVIVKLGDGRSVHHLFCVKVDESGDYIHLPKSLNIVLRQHFDQHPDETASVAATQSGVKELTPKALAAALEKRLVTGNPPEKFIKDILATHNYEQGASALENFATGLDTPVPIPAPNPQPPVPAASPCSKENVTHGKQWARLDSSVSVSRPVNLQCVNIGGMPNLPDFAKVRGNSPNSPNPPNKVMHRHSQLSEDETLHKVANKIHADDSALVKFFAVRHDMILGSHGREDELLINPSTRSRSGRNEMYKRLESIAFELPHEMTRRDIISWWKSNDVYERLNALLITGHGLRALGGQEADMTPLTGAPEQALKRMLLTYDEFQKHALTVFNGIEYNRRVYYAEKVPRPPALQNPDLRPNPVWDADENSAYNHTIYDVNNLVSNTPTTIFRADDSINWIKAGGRPYNETEQTMESLLRYVRNNIETDIGKCDDLVILYGIYLPAASSSVATFEEDDIPRVLRWSDTLMHDATNIDGVKVTLTEKVDEILQERDFAGWVRKSDQDDGIPRMEALPTTFPVLAPRHDRDTNDGIYGWAEMARRILAQRIIDTQVRIFEQLISPIFEAPITQDEIRDQVVQKLHSGTRLFNLNNISGKSDSIWNNPSASEGQIAVHFTMELLQTAYPLIDEAEQLIKSHFLEPLYVWIRRLDGWLFESQLTLDLIVYYESKPASSATLRRRRWRQQVMPESIGYSSSSDLETKIRRSSMFIRPNYPRELPYNLAYCYPLPERVNMQMKINPFLDMGEVEFLNYPEGLHTLQLVWANKKSQDLVKENTSVYFLQTQLGVKELIHKAIYALPFQNPIVFDSGSVGNNAVNKVQKQAVYDVNGQPVGWKAKSIVPSVKFLRPAAPAVGEAGPSGVDPTATNATNAATVTPPLSSSKAREASVEQLRKRIMSLGLAAERLPDRTRTLLQV